MKFGLVTLSVCLVLLVAGCNNSEQSLIPNSGTDAYDMGPKKGEISEAFKAYWYQGEAEITSYRLSQERYGELHDGTMVTIHVTEDLNPDTQVKSDKSLAETIPVLKLNMTKKFLTGVYPYSIMTSTFNPVQHQGHAIKISNSVQDWCGQVYTQLNNRESYEINSYSYFENESDQQLKLDKNWLEDELWNLIRINPESLPTGELRMIPSFESIRLQHTKIEAYPALASLKQGDSISTYVVKYPEMQREVVVYFNSHFPFEIEKWEETNAGWMGDTTQIKTTAVKMRRMKLAYWSKHKNKDTVLRDSLGLNF